MIVCICKRVSDRQVRAAVDDGACTVDAVGEACRAGTGCGACHEQIRDIIDGRLCAGSCALGEPSPLRVLSPYLMPGKAA
jgi:bacterioferritin-associated ferredoxin